MVLRFIRLGLAMASGLLLSVAAVPAQQKPAILEWSFLVSGLPLGQAVDSYLVFDSRQTLEVEWTIRNQSDRGIHVPADFLSRVRFTLKKGASGVEMPAEWPKVFHHSALVSDTVPAGLAVVLGPGDSYGGTAVLAAKLTEGDQDVAMNVAAAVSGLTWSDGTDWQGLHVEEQQKRVRVRQPATLEERRLYHSIESSVALRRGQSADAMRHAREVLRESPNHPSGHALLGNVFFALRRFREAIPELELAKPAKPERSGIYDQLAYCYLAVGDEQKAAATLSGIRSPAQVERSLEMMRSALRRQGGGAR